MIELLKTLDAKITSVCSNVENYIQNPELFIDSVFDEPFLVYDENNRPSGLKGEKGVYVFQITDGVSLSQEQVRNWNDRCRGAGFNDWNQRDLFQGDILYVGSCVSESLYVRIRQHFLKDTTATSLQLRSQWRNMVIGKVRVYAFPMKRIYEADNGKYHKIIIPRIEKGLHERLKPKAGSSRV